MKNLKILLLSLLTFTIFSCTENTNDPIVEPETITSQPESSCEDYQLLLSQTRSKVKQLVEQGAKLSKSEIVQVVRDIRVENGVATPFTPEQSLEIEYAYNKYYAAGNPYNLVSYAAQTEMLSRNFEEFLNQFITEGLASKDMNELENVLTKYSDLSANVEMSDFEIEAFQSAIEKAEVALCMQSGGDQKILCFICAWVTTVIEVVTQVIVWVLQGVSWVLDKLGLDRWVQVIENVITWVTSIEQECWWEHCNETAPECEGVLEDCVENWTFNPDTRNCERIYPPGTVILNGCVALEADDCTPFDNLQQAFGFCIWECDTDTDFPNPVMSLSDPMSGEPTVMAYDPCR